MSSVNPDPEADSGGSGEPPLAPPPTPFDHPLFLPALLLAGVVWFGYDGFLNQDPDMLEHQTFNRVGFVLLAVATLWYGRKGLTEMKELRAESEADPARRGL